MIAKQLPAVALVFFTAAALAQHDHHAAPAGAPAAQAPAESGRPAAARAWTRYPMLAPGMAREGGRMAALLRPVNIEAAEVQVFAADGPPDKRRTTVAVGAEGARIAPAAPDIGNYHWVAARSETDNEVRVASTVWYFSNPGKAPTAMLMESHHELEIVPQPLPREHGNYREAEKWSFVLRYNGQPLPNRPLTLETEFGSRSSFVTDAQGRAVVLFPRDFKPAAPGREEGAHGGPRRAKFVLATEYDEGGKHYLTAFNATYSPDADRNRSLAWGAAFGAFGMLAATPLLRRRPGGNGASHA